MIEQDKMEARWDKLLLYDLPGFLARHPATPCSVPVPFARTHPEPAQHPALGMCPLLCPGALASEAEHRVQPTQAWVLLPCGWHV